jgi:hypothetical protein
VLGALPGGTRLARSGCGVTAAWGAA